jgi:hypothetical protein
LARVHPIRFNEALERANWDVHAAADVEVLKLSGSNQMTDLPFLHPDAGREFFRSFYANVLGQVRPPLPPIRAKQPRKVQKYTFF